MEHETKKRYIRDKQRTDRSVYGKHDWTEDRPRSGMNPHKQQDDERAAEIIAEKYEQEVRRRQRRARPIVIRVPSTKDTPVPLPQPRSEADNLLEKLRAALARRVS